ncbi:carbohydrate binding domain-containing protein [Fervidobacterium islandicum]|uniref:carbohydrate binding domain-containing protein n=1 Tax=Fervidobacterium islandicum TaxID=2423 RepID=UPI003A68C4C1
MRKLMKRLGLFLVVLLLFAYKTEVVADVSEQFELSGTATSLLNNWNFRSNIRNDQVNAPFEWWLWEAAKYGVSDGNVAAYGVKDGYAFIKIAAPGSDTWHIQFNQWVKLKQEKYYLISFRAKADQPRTINVKISMNHDPWVNYFAQTVELTKEWNTYTFYYKHPDKADETVNFCFELGKGPATTVYIADVILLPVDESEVQESKEE